MIREQEIRALRSLASRWMEHASLPVMDDRRRQWKAIKDLQAEKPMILVETCMLSDYIGAEELVCEDPYARNVEKSLFEIVRHADEIGDDIVVDPYFRIPWVIEISDLGIPIEAHHSASSDGSDLGYTFDFGFKSDDDYKKLHLRTHILDREESYRRKEFLENIFGDILPVRLGGYSWFDTNPGYHPWLGNIYGGLTMDLFKLIGNNNLLTWVYDNPSMIHQLMGLIRDDRDGALSSSSRKRASCIEIRIPGCLALAAMGSFPIYRSRKPMSGMCN